MVFLKKIKNVVEVFADGFPCIVKVKSKKQFTDGKHRAVFIKEIDSEAKVDEPGLYEINGKMYLVMLKDILVAPTVFAKENVDWKNCVVEIKGE